MFFPVNAPLDGTCTALQALRRSLNSPVVTLDSLPVGPASAAIALHPGAPDDPRVTIAIRSVQSRQLVFYSADEERASFHSAGVALDAALSFAESMGFLFDDDDVEAGGDEGPRVAARLWSEFAAVAPPEIEAPELLLEEVAELVPAPPEKPLVLDETLPVEVEWPIEAVPTAGPAPLVEPELLHAREPAPPAAVAGAERPEEMRERPPAAEPVAAPAILLTKFRRGAAPVAGQAAPDARIHLLSRF